MNYNAGGGPEKRGAHCERLVTVLTPPHKLKLTLTKRKVNDMTRIVLTELSTSFYVDPASRDAAEREKRMSLNPSPPFIQRCAAVYGDPLAASDWHKSVDVLQHGHLVVSHLSPKLERGRRTKIGNAPWNELASSPFQSTGGRYRVKRERLTINNG